MPNLAWARASPASAWERSEPTSTVWRATGAGLAGWRNSWATTNTTKAQRPPAASQTGIFFTGFLIAARNFCKPGSQPLSPRGFLDLHQFRTVRRHFDLELRIEFPRILLPP